MTDIIICIFLMLYTIYELTVCNETPMNDQSQHFEICFSFIAFVFKCISRSLSFCVLLLPMLNVSSIKLEKCSIRRIPYGFT